MLISLEISFITRGYKLHDKAHNSAFWCIVMSNIHLRINFSTMTLPRFCGVVWDVRVPLGMVAWYGDSLSRFLL